MTKIYINIPADEGQKYALDQLLDSLGVLFNFTARRCLLVETDNPAVKILLQNLPGLYPVPAPEPLSALEEEHEIDFDPPDVLPQTMTAAPEVMKTGNGHKEFPSLYKVVTRLKEEAPTGTPGRTKECADCGAVFTPTQKYQRRCTACQTAKQAAAQTAEQERIDRVVEKGKRHEPPSAEQAVFGRIHSNGTIKGSKI